MAITHTGPTDEEFTTVYLHLSKIHVFLGPVDQGEVVAESGASSGGSENGTGPHLHFHVWAGFGSFDSHTKPFENLFLKLVGIDPTFRRYDARRGDLDDSPTLTTGLFESNNPPKVASPGIIHPDGTFLKPASRNSSFGFHTIYFVEDARIRPFSHFEHYQSWLLDNANLYILVEDEELSAYGEPGPDMSFRPGALIKSSTPDDEESDFGHTVFVVIYQTAWVEGGFMEVPTRKAFTSLTEFQNMGYDEANILHVKEELIGSLFVFGELPASPPEPVDDLDPGDNPPSPFSLSTTPICDDTTSQIRVSWTESDGAAAYTLFITGPATNIERAMGLERSFIHDSLPEGVTYDYTVVANDNFGNETSSGPINATSLFCAPLNFDVIAETVPPYHIGNPIIFGIQLANGAPPFHYQWSGDASGTEPTATEVYLTPGTYTAVCTILDNRVGSEAVTRSKSIEVAEPPGSTGIVNVAATYQNSAWSGSLEYRITGANTGTVVAGRSVPAAHELLPDLYTIELVQGGPPGAQLNGVSPGATATLQPGDQLFFSFTFVDP